MEGAGTSARKTETPRRLRALLLRGLTAFAALAALAPLGPSPARPAARSPAVPDSTQPRARALLGPSGRPVASDHGPDDPKRPVGSPGSRRGGGSPTWFAAAEISAIVEAFNAPEVARRVDYWNYLRDRGRTDGESLDEHVRRYARIIRAGETATAGELAELEAIAGRPLPADLREFYRDVGQLMAGGSPVQIESARRTLERLRLPAAERPRRLRSLGLVDRIHACWGGAREELEPEAGLLTRDQAAALNRRFLAIGWFTTDPGEEGHTYIYFDEAGRFGALFFHQDDEDFLKASLLPMLEASPARQSLADVLLPLLRRHARPARLEEEDEGRE